MSAATIELASAALAKHEAVIARGLKSFIEVGDALLAIRSERLYLATHETFAEYCQDRWGFSDARARQLVAAAKTVGVVTVGGLPAPTSESQARELTKVPEPEREQVWREALDRTDGKPTAAAVREVTAPAEPTPAKPEPNPVPKATTPKPAEHAPAPRSTTARRAAPDEEERRSVIQFARYTAANLVSNLEADVVSIIAGIDFGETDLITVEMIDDLREALEVLEARL